MMENCLLDAMRRPAWAAVRAMIGDMMKFLFWLCEMSKTRVECG